MKCQKCNTNEANVRYTETINGSTREMCLCSECARESGILGRTEDMFSRLERQMISVFANPFSAPLMGRGLFVASAPCVGGSCSEAEAIEPPHKEEVLAPERTGEDAIKAKLLDAIADERYEDAAVLRDELKKLKGE